MAELPAPFHPTLEAILAAYGRRQEARHRDALPVSLLGHDCDRALWYALRRAHAPERHDGRQLRLFETGRREEDRLLDDLEAAGITVWRTDPATGRQWMVEAFGGHLRGYMDGQGIGFPEAPRTRHVIECKTHNEKSFRDLARHGVAASKPAHMAQMQLYMHLSGLKRAVYLAVNKNTDELHMERIAYDEEMAERLMARARRLIEGPQPPPRLHADPSAKMAFICRRCPAFDVCHGGAFAPRHCRTCLHATPRPEGGWRCERHGLMLDAAAQERGCASHLYIPGLVPGEQTDADPERGIVTYLLRDGRSFIDGEAA